MKLIDVQKFDVIGWQGIPKGYEDNFADGVAWLAERIDAAPVLDENGNRAIKEDFEAIKTLYCDCGFTVDLSADDETFKFCPCCRNPLKEGTYSINNYYYGGDYYF